MAASPIEQTTGLRLLLVVTGSVSAAGMPSAIAALRHRHPGHQLRVILTRSALRFVTPVAVSGGAGGEALIDEWPEGSAEARHVAWAEWADAIIVAPATLSFLSRLATGMADSPALLAAQCTLRPVVLAPALPPGGVGSAAYRLHWDALIGRPNIAIAPPRPGVSQSTGRLDAWIPAPLEEVLELVDDCREHDQPERGRPAPADRMVAR